MDDNLLMKNVAIKGFFVVVDKDEHRLLVQEMRLNTSRGGIFYKKEELLDTLKEHHQSFTENNTHIVEIEVEKDCITIPNGHKFGIKKGHMIPIRGIQTYQEALKQIS